MSQPLLRPAIEPTHVGSINLFLVPSVLRLNVVEIIPTVTHVDTAQNLIGSVNTATDIQWFGRCYAGETSI